MYCLCRKNERKINFAQFEKALKLIAEKKYPGDSSGLAKLTHKITSGKGPAASGATAKVSFACKLVHINFWPTRLTCLVGQKFT